MKNLLKYLILFLVTAAFCNAAGRAETISQSVSDSDSLIEVVASAGTLSATPADMINASRTVSFSGPTRVLSGARRTANAHNRSLSGFMKCGKSFNVSVLYSFQRNSVVINTTVVEHAQKLVCLGKLII